MFLSQCSIQGDFTYLWRKNLRGFKNDTNFETGNLMLFFKPLLTISRKIIEHGYLYLSNFCKGYHNSLGLDFLQNLQIRIRFLKIIPLRCLTLIPLPKIWPKCQLFKPNIPIFCNLDCFGVDLNRNFNYHWMSKYLIFQN
jgi:hypothetical protein